MTPPSAKEEGSGTEKNCTSESMVHWWSRSTSTTKADVVTEKPLKYKGTVVPFPDGLVIGKVRVNELSGVRTTMLKGSPTPAELSLSAAQTVTACTSVEGAKLN